MAAAVLDRLFRATQAVDAAIPHARHQKRCSNGYCRIERLSLFKFFHAFLEVYDLAGSLINKPCCRRSLPPGAVIGPHRCVTRPSQRFWVAQSTRSPPPSMFLTDYLLIRRTTASPQPWPDVHKIAGPTRVAVTDAVDVSGIVGLTCAVAVGAVEFSGRVPASARTTVSPRPLPDVHEIAGPLSRFRRSHRRRSACIPPGQLFPLALFPTSTNLWVSSNPLMVYTSPNGLLKLGVSCPPSFRDPAPDAPPMGYAAYDAGRVAEMRRRMVEVVDEANRWDPDAVADDGRCGCPGPIRVCTPAAYDGRSARGVAVPTPATGVAPWPSAWTLPRVPAPPQWDRSGRARWAADVYRAAAREKGVRRVASWLLFRRKSRLYSSDRERDESAAASDDDDEGWLEQRRLGLGEARAARGGLAV
ncbi:hypothetical protein GGX14DRAFT_648059 [Mycena pura]|uniref:Uncharacterized protein n=1 Tax=Mycena pura TaxID=153505 RepID=A0AAD6V6I1_9AGAR|nr:hypothetical protein GGX14DRAFT_648059 [Mycena pura]